MAVVKKRSKSSSARERSGRESAAPGEASETQARAQKMIDETKASAAAMLDDARRRVADEIRTASETGQQEGFAQAEHMRDEIGGMEQRMLKEVEGEVVRTALQIAEELLGEEMGRRDDAIVDLVVSALQSAQDAREVFLRIHPSQAAILRKHRSSLKDALTVAREVDVREDRKVTPGGVLIQTESGVIDAQLDTQLAEIARVLGT